MDHHGHSKERTLLLTACATALTIGTACAIQHYRRNYHQGRIISLRNYLLTYPARRRMRAVIRSMLPLWKSKYDISSASTSPIRFKRSDVIVFAPPKCGTTWVTHMCHQIRTRGAEVSFEDQDDIVPWVERLGTRYLEGSHFNDCPNADHVASPRIFKSHLNWESRPEGSYKQIWVFRNFVDMMASVSHFLPSLWGIHPALDELEMCSFLMESGDVEEAMQSLSCAWEHRKNAGVLLLFYENIIEDHRGTAESLARFMNVSLSVAELDRIVGQTSKDGMLQHHSAFACRIQARNAHRARGIVLHSCKLVGKVRPDNHAHRNDGNNAHRNDMYQEMDEKPSHNSDVILAVQRAWQFFVVRNTGIPNYQHMRKAVY